MPAKGLRDQRGHLGRVHGAVGVGVERRQVLGRHRLLGDGGRAAQRQRAGGCDQKCPHRSLPHPHASFAPAACRRRRPRRLRSCCRGRPPRGCPPGRRRRRPSVCRPCSRPHVSVPASRSRRRRARLRCRAKVVHVPLQTPCHVPEMRPACFTGRNSTPRRFPRRFPVRSRVPAPRRPPRSPPPPPRRLPRRTGCRGSGNPPRSSPACRAASAG